MRGLQYIESLILSSPILSSSPSDPAPVSMDLWRKIYARMQPYWKGVALATLLLSVAAATQPTLAVLMKPLLDGGFSGDKPAYIWSIPLALIGLILLRGLCSFASDYLLAWVANNMLLGIRRDMFEHLLGLADTTFKRSDKGRLLNRFTMDAGNITGLATQVITTLVRETLVVLALVCVLLYLSWQLTLIVLVVLPLSVLIARLFIRRLRRINRETIQMNAALTRIVREGIDGQRVIKLFEGHTNARARFDYINARLRRFAMRAASADAAMTPLTQCMIAISVALVIAVALYQSHTQGLTVGGFAAFMAALGQIFDPIKRLTSISGTMQRMLASAESVFSLFEQAIEDDAGTRQCAQPVRGHIVFEAVSHRFPDAQVNTLDRVSLTVEPGQTVALVGRSGSGKTTLVNMLPRFILPTSGRLCIDGMDVQELTLRSLRAQLALVSQDVVLFSGTIRENVAYGALGEVSDAQILAALEAANLSDFALSLPNGLDTHVGESADQLSGGQRQRLAIARALIKNAPILILDEATSALDNVSERQVQDSLEQLMRGRTTLVIAHRLSTVQTADTIVVLDGGRIVEQGTHAALLANQGLYAALYQTQFRDDMD